MKLVLMGYMASGKSIIAKYLAKKTRLKWIDLDDYIEKKENQSISEIFKNKGEIYFRIAENKYLKQLLEKNEDLIIALGGGTPCYAGNLDLIKKHAQSAYLKASIQTIADRLESKKSTRPLVKDIKNTDLKEFIAKHLFERSNFYSKADKTIVVDGKNPEQISDEIKTEFYSK